VAGYIANNQRQEVEVVRFDATGMLDSSFNFSGRVNVGFGTGSDEARSVAIQPDGKIVVAGHAGSQFLVARFNSNGSLDNSFDGDGAAFTTVGTGAAMGNALVLDKAGRILVA